MQLAWTALARPPLPLLLKLSTITMPLIRAAVTMFPSPKRSLFNRHNTTTLRPVVQIWFLSLVPFSKHPLRYKLHGSTLLILPSPQPTVASLTLRFRFSDMPADRLKPWVRLQALLDPFPCGALPPLTAN
jgi:hypothetical protein